MALISPVPSIMRAGFVSTNLFSLLCVGDVPATSNDLISIKRFGAPILYLIGQIAFYLGLLVWKDSGSLFRLVAKKARSHAAVTESNGEQGMHRRLREDVVAEAKRVAQSNDALRVIKLSKAFGGKTVVEDATFGAEEGTILALLGPNGAGKTTTFNMIRTSFHFSNHVQLSIS
jgi:ATP-binding cassette subfamily A (ABC1) protein 3